MDSISQLDFNNRADAETWNSFVFGREDAHCTDLAEWRLLFGDLYGLPYCAFAYKSDGRIVGGASAYLLASPLMGRMVVTCPYFGYGGLLADNPDIEHGLVDAVEDWALESGADVVEWRIDRPLPPPHLAHRDFSEFNLYLPASADSVWNDSLTSNVRQNLRKAENNALRFALSDDPANAYGLLCRTLRKHGTPFHGLELFRMMKTRFKSDVQFSEVYDHDRLTAAGVVVRFKDKVSTPYIGSLADGRERGANYCQYWGIITDNLARGIRHFEMGRSPAESTHAQFKEKWGAIPTPMFYNYRVLRPGAVYRTVSRPTLWQRAAVQTWRHLPLAVTRCLGPRLARHIP